MANSPCTKRYPIPFRLVAEHYGNTIQLIIEWSFLHGKIKSKKQAEQCLRYFLKNI